MVASSLDQLSRQEANRVQDYLSDKIQSLADLESLDSLLSNLGAQHELQRKQVNQLPLQRAYIQVESNIAKAGRGTGSS